MNPHKHGGDMKYNQYSRNLKATNISTIYTSVINSFSYHVSFNNNCMENIHSSLYFHNELYQAHQPIF